MNKEKLLEEKLKSLPLNYYQAKDLEAFFKNKFDLDVKLTCTKEESYKINPVFFSNYN